MITQETKEALNKIISYDSKRDRKEYNLFDSIKFNLQFFADDDEDDDEEEDKTTTTQNSGNKPKDTVNNGEKLFTQTQLNRLLAQEKKDGRRSVLTQLGVSEDNATDVLTQFNAFMDAKRKKEQEENKGNTESQAQQNRELQELKREMFIAKSQTEALKLGVKTDYVEDVVTLAIAKFKDGDDMKTVLTEIKEKHKNFFVGSSEESEEEKEKNVGKKGTGTSVKSSKVDNEETKDKKDKKKQTSSLGSRLAQDRNEKVTAKKSYFDR